MLGRRAHQRTFPLQKLASYGLGCFLALYVLFIASAWLRGPASATVQPAIGNPLVAAGSEQYPSLRAALSGSARSRDARPLRVCIMTFAFVGPIKNGGIATADTALAEELVAAGHQVTVLYLWGSGVQIRNIEHWVEYYKRRGILLVPLPATPLKMSPACPSKYATKAYEAFLWLRARQHAFDVLHVHEWHGPAYYIALAKHQGTDFQGMTIVTTVHCPALFYLAGNLNYLTSFNYLASDFLERSQVAMSDVVISPSQFMLGWVSEQGWQLPAQRTFVHQNLLSADVWQLIAAYRGGGDAGTAAATSAVSDDPPTLVVRELVFFARLEVLKGFGEFCDALDLLAEEVARGELPAFNITFLGNPNLVGQNAEDVVWERAERWPWAAVALITDFIQPEAVAYMRGREPDPMGPQTGRLAVLPSLVENSPYTVLECLALAIPFVASNVGGIPELIHPADRSRVLFAPRAAPLAAKLREVLLQGAPVARAAQPPEDTRRTWIDFHAALPAWPTPLPNPASAASQASTLPLISVCIAHHERGDLLLQTINAVLLQDYANIEIIIVDDGSKQERPLRVLQLVETLFGAVPSSLDWKHAFPASSFSAEEAARPLTVSSNLVSLNRARQPDADQVFVPHVAAPQRTRALRTPFRLVRQANRFPGAARNVAASAARGEFVAILDDDDIPRRDWLSSMQRVTAHTSADVVTCMCDFFTGEHVPADTGGSAANGEAATDRLRALSEEGMRESELRWLTLGAAPDLGLFHNVFGAYAALMRRAALVQVGGYSEDPGSTFEDYELFASFVLEGLRLELVPRPLLWYRQYKREAGAAASAAGEVATAKPHLMRTTNTFTNRMRALRPFLKAVPPPLRNAVLMGYSTVRTLPAPSAKKL